MTPEKIKKLLAEGEGLTVEFKECVNELSNSVFETVCSFSNRYGGHMILGVDDNGVIIGVNPKAIKDIKRNFINMLSNPQKISPPLLLELEEVDFGGQTVLYVYVPISSQVELCSNKIYDRSGDADIDITRSTNLAADLYGRKSSAYTEREIFPFVTENELRFDLVERAQKMALGENRDHPWKGMSSMELMKSAGLYDEDWRTGKKGFNLACILLFGKDDVIRSCAPGFETDALVRRENIDRYDDRLIVGTNLIEAYDMLTEFIAKHTLDRFFLVDNQRVSVRSWIARELVSNILAHREYSKGFPAKIIIESDRIYTENWNRSNRHGRIDPNDFTPEPKNPIIAQFFVNIGRADKLGSGVRNLYKYTKIYSGGEPELIEGDVFKAIVPLIGIGAIGFTGDINEIEVAESLPDSNATKLPDNEMLPDKATKTLPDNEMLQNKATELLPNTVVGILTPTEIKFLNSLMTFFSIEEWITNTEAREASGKSESSVKRYMRNLINKGALESRGKTKNRQYRLILNGD
ncbi:MAG: putative DNA binding domain-containing protein [Eubacteriaceae bacterium]|nr:putative DNA binding domain-containing protein [Eubacteriaceae bacterium]